MSSASSPCCRATRQTLFFSATLGPEIRRLGDAFLNNPKEIVVSRPASVATTIVEGLALVAEHDKREALRRLIRTQHVQNALIFCNRKRDVDVLHKSLTRHKFDVGALHGDMAQTVRFATLEKFKANDLRLLVCSDVAARGLDIGGLSHVFNFDVPHHAEDYVHRIGRTGRAGLTGHAFTIAAPTDRFAVEAIEKLTGHAIPPMVVEGLDPVDWTEEDGRKRRGRAPARGAARAAPRAKPAPRAEGPRAAARGEAPKSAEPAAAAQAPPRGRAEPRSRAKPRATPASAPPPHPAQSRRATRSTYSERAPAGHADRHADRHVDRHADRHARRERDGEAASGGPGGAAVRGFGSDVPAFMRLRPRVVPAARSEGDSEA